MYACSIRGVAGLGVGTIRVSGKPVEMFVSRNRSEKKTIVKSPFLQKI